MIGIISQGKTLDRTFGILQVPVIEQDGVGIVGGRTSTGDMLGFDVGTANGENDGTNTCTGVGDRGIAVGAGVGTVVGTDVGVVVGAMVGAIVGVFNGASVGYPLGTEVG
jgi:hypothetical protein